MCAAFRLFTDNLIKVAHHILLGPSLFFPSGKLHIRGDWKGGEIIKKKKPHQTPTSPKHCFTSQMQRQLRGIEQHTGDNSRLGLTLQEQGMTLQTALLYPQHSRGQLAVFQALGTRYSQVLTSQHGRRGSSHLSA